MIVNTKAIAAAIALGHQLLPVVGKLIGEVGFNTKAKADLIMLQGQIEKSNAIYEATVLDIQKQADARIDTLFRICGVVAIGAFCAGVALAFVAFRLQIVKVG